MPSGILNSMGCDFPSAKATILPLSSARYPTPTMSRSFLKPCVTPCTALATSARARPCSARCSSVARLALSTPSFCSKVMPKGTPTVSLPLGPCTSTSRSFSAIFTPCGTGIGLLPIRDIATRPRTKVRRRFSRGAPAHQTFRRRQNADAQAADHGSNIGGAKVSARARTRNALHAGDDAAAVRGVFQEHAEHLACLVLIDELEGRDVALILQDARDFGLQLGDRNVHALVLGSGGVANTGQKIAYGIRLHNFPMAPTSSPSRRREFLP